MEQDTRPWFQMPGTARSYLWLAIAAREAARIFAVDAEFFIGLRTETRDWRGASARLPSGGDTRSGVGAHLPAARCLPGGRGYYWLATDAFHDNPRRLLAEGSPVGGAGVPDDLFLCSPSAEECSLVFLTFTDAGHDWTLLGKLTDAARGRSTTRTCSGPTGSITRDEPGLRRLLIRWTGVGLWRRLEGTGSIRARCR